MPEAVHNGSFLLPLIIFLAAAVVAVPLFRIARLGAVVGYLAAGIVIGPSGWALISDAGTVMHIAELGVVLLLFIIGLELKPARLLAMRHAIIGLGLGQMVITTAVLALALFWFAGFNTDAALIAGVALAFSSTAIAMQLLEERGTLGTVYGRKTFAILLAQDVLVAPVLAVIPLLAGASAAAGGSWTDGLVAVLTAAAAFAVVILAGRYITNPFFAALSRWGAREIMTAAALLVVVGAALLMQVAGMSMALGAFLAGLLLSESHFRHQLEADIEPFRGLLMGLFFMSVGMSIDGKIVMDNAAWLGGWSVAIIVIKGLIVFGLIRASGCTRPAAVAGASVLTMAGEFAFVVFPVAAGSGLLAPQTASLLAALTAITMVISPVLAKGLEMWANRPAQDSSTPPAEEIPDGAKGSILVVGFGRFGQLAVQVLLGGRADVTVIDNNVERIRTAMRFGFKVYYGDGTRLDVLRAAGAENARLLLICVDDRDAANNILELARNHFPLTDVYARAWDRVHALRLLDNGAAHVVRETSESALKFGEAALAALLDDSRRANTIASEIRKLDFERLSLQQTEGLAAGHDVYRPKIEPEPLTKPSGKAEVLNAGDADLSGGGEQAREAGGEQDSKRQSADARSDTARE